VFPVVLVMANSTALGVTPVTGTPTVATLNAGLCHAFNGTVITPASIRVSWSVTNPDAANYSAKLYKDGILISTQDTAASMTYDETISGQVVDAPHFQWTSNWVFRVDIAAKSDGAVVSSKTSLAWQETYGTCSDLA
jgi:hypothetical protein